MKICVAGAAGAFGIKHLDAIAAIGGIEVVSVVGREADEIEGFAKSRGIPHWTDGPGGEPGAAGCRGRDPDHADANARRAGRSMHARGQARA